MGRSPGRLGCALESRGRDEDVIGTASRVLHWLVVEQPGPWGKDAIRESRLDHNVAETLRSRSRRTHVRVLLARRPGWEDVPRHRVYLAHSGRWHHWIEQLDVDDPHELTRLDLQVIAHDQPPGIGARGPNVHLVCTHGRHDPCCADFGRPVVRALHAAGTPEVWETSHIGGDRFAANMLCLPTGVYYGRVPPEEAARIVQDHDNGLIDLACYRGLSCFSPMTQAADVFARRELGERRLAALRLREADLQGDELRATFDHEGATVEVHVSRQRSEPTLLTCAEVGEAHPWHYRLLALRPLPS